MLGEQGSILDEQGAFVSVQGRHTFWFWSGPDRHRHCRANGHNVTDVLERLTNGHPINQIDDLLPWNWQADGD